MAPSRLVSASRIDRHEQTLVVEVDGDAEVDEVVHDELVVADAGVEVRELGEGVDDRPAR